LLYQHWISPFPQTRNICVPAFFWHNERSSIIPRHDSIGFFPETPNKLAFLRIHRQPGSTNRWRLVENDLIGRNPVVLQGGPTYRFPIRPQQIVTMRFRTASALKEIKPLLKWDELAPELKREARNIHTKQKAHPPRAIRMGTPTAVQRPLVVFQAESAGMRLGVIASRHGRRRSNPVAATKQIASSSASGGLLAMTQGSYPSATT